jgi:hypothetical protein
MRSNWANVIDINIKIDIARIPSPNSPSIVTAMPVVIVCTAPIMAAALPAECPYRDIAMLEALGGPKPLRPMRRNTGMMSIINGTVN